MTDAVAAAGGGTAAWFSCLKWPNSDTVTIHWRADKHDCADLLEK